MAVRVERNRGYNRNARRILKLPAVQDFLLDIGREIRNAAGPGHRVQRDSYGDRVGVEVNAWTFEARQREARDKTLTRAFSAARRQPRNYF